MITLTSRFDGFSFSALHVPAQGTRRGGLVLAQEIFGVTPPIRAISERFAALGFEVIAPSLFDRVAPGFEVPIDQDGIAKGLAAVQATSVVQLAGDLQAAVDALGGPVFLTGFCWGGAAAWVGAARCEGVVAASCFYGRLINSLLHEVPRVPTILHYGAQDTSIPQTMIDEVHRAHARLPIHLYDAGHGFCRMGHPAHDAAACDLAVERTVAHFLAHA